MPFYKLIVAYDGTEFHGFQRQIDNATMDSRYRPPAAGGGGDGSPAAPVLALQSFAKQQQKKRTRGGDNATINLSIQEVLESAILHLFPHVASVADLRMRFAGRTDKGVHAAGQVVQIYLAATTATTADATTKDGTGPFLPPPWMLRRSLNSRLPPSISVESAEQTTAAFNPRKDCVRKVYEYSIRFRCYDSKLPDKARQGTHSLRSALDHTNRLWICPWALELDTVVKVCATLQGTHDYSNFIHKDDRGRRDNTMTIDEIKFVIDQEKVEMIAVAEDDDDTAAASAVDHQDDDDEDAMMTIASRVITGRFRLTAASFRRSMVRLIVQFCVDAGRAPMVAVDASVAEDIFTTAPETTSIRATAPACGLCLVSVTY
jgi:tRNA pseudouridine(38-40) synthase